MPPLPGLSDASGTVAPTSGTFTETPAAGVGSELNPYVDPGPWGFVLVGNLFLPGVVQSIDGAEKPEEWSVQKGTSSSGATTVWKGSKLAESIKIVLALHDASTFAQYYVVRDTLRPQPGKKPPSLTLSNPSINFNGITRVAVVNVGMPKWSASGGYWTGEVTLIEFNPSKETNAGPASPAKPGGKDAPDPNADANKELQKTLDAAAAA